jgi:hypothetical protein
VVPNGARVAGGLPRCPAADPALALAVAAAGLFAAV